MPQKLRKLTFILFLLIALQGFPQTKVYKSLATEYLSNPQMEWIERDIAFSDSLISIKTYIDSTNDIQEFMVIESGEGVFKEMGNCKYYRCNSSDGKIISTFFIPITEKVERIEALVPDHPGVKPQHYRFYID